MYECSKVCTSILRRKDFCIPHLCNIHRGCARYVEVRAAAAEERRESGDGGKSSRHPTRCRHCGAELGGAPGSAEASEHMVSCAAGMGQGNFQSVL